MLPWQRISGNRYPGSMRRWHVAPSRKRCPPPLSRSRAGSVQLPARPTARTHNRKPANRDGLPTTDCKVALAGWDRKHCRPCGQQCMPRLAQPAPRQSDQAACQPEPLQTRMRRRPANSRWPAECGAPAPAPEPGCNHETECDQSGELVPVHSASAQLQVRLASGSWHCKKD